MIPWYLCLNVNKDFWTKDKSSVYVPEERNDVAVVIWIWSEFTQKEISVVMAQEVKGLWNRWSKEAMKGNNLNGILKTTY